MQRRDRSSKRVLESSFAPEYPHPAVAHGDEVRANSKMDSALSVPFVQERARTEQPIFGPFFHTFKLSGCGNAFKTWIKANSPDALISFDPHVPEWLAKLGLRIPDDIGLVVHDWTSRMVGFAGIHQKRNHVAAAAVDLVATQLRHNERGIPEVPRQILIPPAWIGGASIRPK
jgi:hypothetical protein